MAVEKKGLLRGLASVFVETDEPAKKPADDDEEEGKNAPPPVASTSRPRVPPRAQPDEAIVAKLEEALAASGAEAVQTVFDTFESLAEDVPNAEARMRAAIRVATKQGVDRAAILSDFDRLESVLKDKEGVFERDVARQTGEAITARSEHLHELQETVAASHKEIEAIQARIAETVSESEKVRAEIAEGQSKIDAARAAFTASVDRVRAHITEQRGLVTRILNPANKD